MKKFFILILFFSPIFAQYNNYSNYSEKKPSSSNLPSFISSFDTIPYMWKETGKTRCGFIYQDIKKDTRKHIFWSTVGTINYKSDPDSDLYDTRIDMTLVRIDNAQLDGWHISQSGWHFALGQPEDKSDDGWVGFGGRGGQNWLQFRLIGFGYLHYTTREWDDIGGPPAYDRSNLSRSIQYKINPVNGDTLKCMSNAEWRNLWNTPNGGEVYIRWRLNGEMLKEDIIIDSLAREWVKGNRPPSTPLDETYFAALYRLDVSDISKWVKNEILQNIEGDFDDSDGQIEIRDALNHFLGFMPISEVRVDRSFLPPYRPPREQVVQELRKRVWKEPDGNYYLLIGIRCDLVNQMVAGSLIFDPTWGYTAIQNDNHDGEDNAGTWYVRGVNNDGYLYLAEANYDESPAFSWQFPAILNSATVDYAWFSARTRDENSGTVGYYLGVQDYDYSSGGAYWSSSNKPSAASWIRTYSKSHTFATNTWYYGDADPQTTNMNQAIQDLLAKWGNIDSGDFINFAIMQNSSGSDYGSFRDYYYDTDGAELYLEWTEGGGEPEKIARRRLIE